MMLARMSYCDV